jgi:hypothetical protein
MQIQVTPAQVNVLGTTWEWTVTTASGSSSIQTQYTGAGGPDASPILKIQWSGPVWYVFWDLDGLESDWIRTTPGVYGIDMQVLSHTAGGRTFTAMIVGRNGQIKSKQFTARGSSPQWLTYLQLDSMDATFLDAPPGPTPLVPPVPPTPIIPKKSLPWAQIIIAAFLSAIGIAALIGGLTSYAKKKRAAAQ